ncbi:MAG: prepilin-type N-terminal cleavage/methylation domain-containing protein [Acidobacteriia bacterium]|nr:prepilin-type N-terminal cleavage/methylation domain-containing protein [Terriglobia bacterium]
MMPRLAPSTPRRAPPASGFTLLEVIVATAIVGLVFVAMMEIFSSGLRTEGQADEYATAMQHATRVMNDLLINTRQSTPTQFSGTFDDGAIWQASSEIYHSASESAESTDNLPLVRMLLRVQVTWRSRGGTERHVEIQSLKNILRESSKS